MNGFPLLLSFPRSYTCTNWFGSESDTETDIDDDIGEDEPFVYCLFLPVAVRVA
jgi:hypothetical protein